MGTYAPSVSTSAYEQAFACAPIGMGLVGLDSRFIDVNDAMGAIAGRARDELIGMSFDAITHPDDVDEDLALATQVVRGERNLFMREKRYVRPDGSSRWVHVSGALIRDDSGTPLHFAFHVQDITERRNALHALARSEERFRSAFDDALTGMVLTGPDGRVRRINAVACEILGHDAARLVGVPEAEFTHPDDAAADAERMRSIVAGETDGGRWEKRYLHASGRTVWTEVSTVLVRDPDGSPRHFITQVADISERKQAERVKDEFLTTITHELRTPLTAIQGYTALLTEDEDLSLGVRRNAAEVIHRNAERLKRLVDDVQFIAQARSETLSITRAGVQLDRVVTECVEWARARAAHLDIGVSVTMEEIHLEAADADLLVQAVDHLLSNALNYTAKGGKVEIRLTRERDEAVLAVTDTGIGVSESDCEQLFERFFRASSAVDAAVPGVGLGLSIVKAIVELHGGRIDVSSVPGEGTDFTVHLPTGA
jgi:two-component system phosphate regulon sensor histidine kinase PhoR